MKKEIFTREEVKELLREAVKQSQRIRVKGPTDDTHRQPEEDPVKYHTRKIKEYEAKGDTSNANLHRRKLRTVR